MKARKYEEMVRENIEARLEIKSLKLDNEKLRLEVEKVNQVFWLFSKCFLI